MASFVNPVRPMSGSFVPFNALIAGDEYGFLKYFDDYYNFVDGPAASKTLLPLFNATHWIDEFFIHLKQKTQVQWLRVQGP